MLRFVQKHRLSKGKPHWKLLSWDFSSITVFCSSHDAVRRFIFLRWYCMFSLCSCVSFFLAHFCFLWVCVNVSALASTVLLPFRSKKSSSQNSFKQVMAKSHDRPARLKGLPRYCLRIVCFCGREINHLAVYLCKGERLLWMWWKLAWRLLVFLHLWARMINCAQDVRLRSKNRLGRVTKVWGAPLSRFRNFRGLLWF